MGDRAPDFTINEAGGGSYKLSDLRGKVVMLQFTASWCSVCRTEMPFIEKEVCRKKRIQDWLLLALTGMNLLRQYCNSGKISTFHIRWHLIQEPIFLDFMLIKRLVSPET